MGMAIIQITIYCRLCVCIILLYFIIIIIKGINYCWYYDRGPFFFLFRFSRDHLVVIKYCNITAVPQLQGGGVFLLSPLIRPSTASECLAVVPRNKTCLTIHQSGNSSDSARETGMVRFPELPIPFFH